jgi:hypothetical protein
MMMTPTAATEALLGLHPIHVKMEAKAWVEIYRQLQRTVVAWIHMM